MQRDDPPAPTITVHMEFLGPCRLLAGVARTDLTCRRPAGVRELQAALGQRFPQLRGRVLSDSGETLLEAYLLLRNGRHIPAPAETELADGDQMVLISASVGG